MARSFPLRIPPTTTLAQQFNSPQGWAPLREEGVPMRRRLALGAFVSLVVVAACAPVTTTASLHHEIRNPMVLSRTEWTGANVSTAFDAIEQLRPQFFRSRGETSILLRSQTQTSVYLDTIRLGGLEALRDVPISGIESIRYLSAGEATNRWGTNQTGGAIQLVSR